MSHLTRCGSSPLRKLFLLFLPLCTFGWAVASNAVQASSKHDYLPCRRSLGVPLPSIQLYNSSSLQRLSALLMPKWKLRGRKPLRSNEESQSINISSASNSNCLSNSSDPALPLRPYSKRRRLNGCTVRDISISQSRDTLPGGVPQFIVQIYNTCTTGGCAPSKVHVNCGWFASRVLVNPSIFQRLAYNDCLVNAGHPLQRGQILRFTYQNSFMYPLSFKSAQFC